MTGSVTVRWLLAGSDSRDSALGGPGLLGAVVAVVGMVALGVGQLLAFRDPFAPLAGEAELLFLGTSWGHAWTVALAGCLVAAVHFLLLRRRDDPREGGSPVLWVGATAVVATLSWFPSFVGHAAGSERLPALAMVSDGVHVLAAGAWLGSLGVMLLLFFLPRLGFGEAAAPADLVPKFSAVALGSGATLVTTGLFASWLHLSSVADLLGSGYGRLLLLKLAVVCLVAILGFGNWRRWRRSVREGGPAEIHPHWALAELVVAHVVLAVTAFLVGTAPPG